MKKGNKLFKRLLSFVAAIAMVLGMGFGSAIPAMAATPEYSITIKNTNDRVSIAGKTYYAFKVFDMTLGNETTTGEGENQKTTYGAYAYTIKSNDWAFATIIKNGTKTAATADSNGVYTLDAYKLKLTPTGTTGTGQNAVTTYNVESTFDESTTESQKSEYARKLADALTSVLPTTGSGESKKYDADGSATVPAKDNDQKLDSESVTIGLDYNSETGKGGPGYYAVYGTARPTDPTATQTDLIGAVALTSTDKTPTIEPKVDAPTLDKKITGVTESKENATASTDNIIDRGTGTTGTIATAQVGDTVSFQLDSVVPDLTGYSNYTYTITDTLSDGLDFVTTGSGQNIKPSVTIKINSKNTGSGTTEETASDRTLTETTDYTAALSAKVENGSDSRKLTITIPYATLKKYNKGDAIKITYSATVNDSALSTNYENNTANLKYSNNPSDNTSTETTPDKKTYVIDVDINVDKVNSSNTATKVPGAKFKLYRTSAGDAKEYYKYDSTNKKVTWVTETEENKGDEFITGSDGSLYAIDSSDSKKASTTKATFKGLDAGTYYLEETQAPDGFNKLANPVKIKISAIMGVQMRNATSQKVIINYWVDDAQLPATATNGTITLGTSNTNQPVVVPQIQNTAGTELPSTGGIGTTIFYVIGGVLVAGAAILLISRRRRNA